MRGRGLLAAALLIAIALACLTVSRRLEHQRRFVSRLRRQGALDAAGNGHPGVPLEELSEADREAAESLASLGLVAIRQGRCYLKASELGSFRRKRIRLALSGAVGALLLAIMVATLILRR